MCKNLAATATLLIAHFVLLFCSKKRKRANFRNDVAQSNTRLSVNSDGGGANNNKLLPVKIGGYINKKSDDDGGQMFAACVASAPAQSPGQAINGQSSLGKSTWQEIDQDQLATTRFSTKKCVE